MKIHNVHTREIDATAEQVPVVVARGFDDIYERLDIAIYSPLCLALGAGAAWALARGGGHPAY